jgi:hypothetical protein
MKIKTEKDFIKWINDLIILYKPILGLELQRIKVTKDKETKYLSIKFTYPYLDPTINFSNEAFEDWKEGKLEEDSILHELCHCLTDPLYSKAFERFTSHNEIEDERERLTDKIAVIVRNLLK